MFTRSYNIHDSFVDKLHMYIVILILQMELATQKRFCCAVGHNSHDVTACFFFMSLFFSDLNLTEEKSHGCVAFSFCVIIFCFTLKNVLINQQKIVIMIYVKYY